MVTWLTIGQRFRNVSWVLRAPSTSPEHTCAKEITGVRRGVGVYNASYIECTYESTTKMHNKPWEKTGTDFRMLMAGAFTCFLTLY